MFFTPVEQQGMPPSGLTDAGGIIAVIDSTGFVQEAVCADAACSAPGKPVLGGIAGTVESVPEPSSLLVAGASLAWLGKRVYRSRHPFRKSV
jgi:hypothetical protein